MAGLGHRIARILVLANSVYSLAVASIILKFSTVVFGDKEFAISEYGRGDFTLGWLVPEDLARIQICTKVTRPAKKVYAPIVKDWAEAYLRDSNRCSHTFSIPSFVIL